MTKINRNYAKYLIHASAPPVDVGNMGRGPDLYRRSRRSPSQFESDSFGEDHLCFCGTMTHLARFSVLLAIQPLLCALYRFELQHDNALWLPIALERLRRPAADDVLAAIFFHGRAGEFLVFFVASWIDNLDFDDHVGRHVREV